MKKTLLTAVLALACSASVLAATTTTYTLGDVTYTTQTSVHNPHNNNHMSTVNGISFTLTDTLLTKSSSDAAWTTASNNDTTYAATADSKVALTSITLWEKGNQNDVALPATITITGTDGVSIVSTAVTRHDDDRSVGCLHDGGTWSFTFDSSDLLTVGNTYTITFQNAEGNNITNWGQPVVSVGADNGFAHVTNGTTYQPSNMTLVAQSVKVVPAASIPEPATATLSLLALAGLAARRRRK